MTEPAIDLDAVRAEIAEEVRERRANGEFNAMRERELQWRFAQYAPVQSKRGALSEALSGVDSVAFIDPLVPVDSNHPAGAYVKKAMRKAGLWYFDWLASQTTRALSSVAGALHLIDAELAELRARLDVIADDDTPVVELDGPTSSSSWWASPATEALAGVSGRALVAACGDGWLVASLVGGGVDAYGIDPRIERLMEATSVGLDLRDEALLDHLGTIADDRLGGLVLTGVTEALAPVERKRLLSSIGRVTAPGSVVLVHTLHPDAVLAGTLPPALDVAGSRPMRPSTWTALLGEQGFSTEVTESPDGREVLVVARRPAVR